MLKSKRILNTIHFKLAKLNKEKRKDVKFMLRIAALINDKEVESVCRLQQDYLDALAEERNL